MSAPIKDGGSAFPIPDSHHANGQVQYGSNGMTLRDYFAGQAMTAIINDEWRKNCGKEPYQYIARGISSDAYEIADAMILYRSKNEASV